MSIPGHSGHYGVTKGGHKGTAQNADIDRAQNGNFTRFSSNELPGIPPSKVHTNYQQDITPKHVESPSEIRMNINTKSLIIGWFSALILLWLVVSLNSNASPITQENLLQSADATQQVEIKRQSPRGF